ncbi:MAG: ABC transporter ATP-binding protein [Acidobacteriota bacterium]
MDSRLDPGLTPGSPTPAASVLRVEGLSVAVPSERGPKPVVRNVSLSLAAGEMVGLVGESGCGKTMSVLALAGLLPPGIEVTGGRILVGDEEIQSLPPAARRRLLGRRIGMVFQEPASALNPSLTIGFQLVEAVRIHRALSRTEAADEAVQLLEQVAMPAPRQRLRLYPHQLSGGQVQRVTLAMALAGKPEVLLADEPTTALDVTVQAQILDLLQILRARLGLAVLLVTHDLAVVAESCDRALVLHAGEVVEEGPVRSLLDRPQHPYTRSLVAAYPELGRGTSDPVASAARRKADAEKPLLRARGLAKTYRPPGGDRVRALRGVDLDVFAGRTLAVVGESGCGKSTLARCLVRLDSPDAGSIALDGEDLLALDGAELRRRRRDFQLVFQDPGGSLDPRMRIGSSLEEPLRIHRLASKAERPSRLRDLLAEVGLPAEIVDRFPHQLSGGQRQRVAIARALACEPRLLVADEPVSGLDVSRQSQIIDLLVDLQRRRGLALVLIAHDLGLVESASQDVVVMYLGRVVERGPTATVFRSPQHPYTAALLESAPRLYRASAGLADGDRQRTDPDPVQ